MSDRETPERDGDRTAELIGGAVAGDLSAAEQSELEALGRADPQVAADWAMAVAAALALADQAPLPWREAEPPAALAAAVRSAATAPSERRRVPLLAAAALALVLGAAGGWVLGQASDDPPTAASPAEPTGPPGTLGAVEAIEFAERPGSVRLEAAVVAHTWGTETRLDAFTGLVPGDTYDVVLVTSDGGLVDAGSFTATRGEIECRLMGAALRQDVAAIAVRTRAGAEVMRSELPAVEVSAAS